MAAVPAAGRKPTDRSPVVRKSGTVVQNSPGSAAELNNLQTNEQQPLVDLLFLTLDINRRLDSSHSNSNLSRAWTQLNTILSKKKND